MPLHLTPEERLILALDVDSGEEARALVQELEGAVSFYKVGLELFAAAGPDFVKELVGSGKKVFLDLKWIDIPETVAKAVRVAARFGVTFATLDGNGDRKSMEAAVAARNAARGEGREIRLLCVTALTHLDDAACQHMYGRTVSQLVGERTEKALNDGLDGVISSGKEVSLIRGIADRRSRPEEFLIVTPGMRFPDSSKDDHQSRATHPETAVAEGASCIVVGRPIRGASDRKGEARRFIDAIRSGLAKRPIPA